MPFVVFFVRVFSAFVLAIFCVDYYVRCNFPILPRLSSNFSSVYLQRAIEALNRNDIAVLGDSVLWGYRLKDSQVASIRLQEKGLPFKNLAFEGGSVANTYSLIRYMQATHALPRLVIFNINLKVFNSADSAYNKLHPSVEALCWNSLSADQKKRLSPTRKSSIDNDINDHVSKVWYTYALRSDIRELLFGDIDLVHALGSVVHRFSGEQNRADAAHIPTSEAFMGTYDLDPLQKNNVQVEYLKDLVTLSNAVGLKMIVLLTPTNHTLLHDYINVPEYDNQLALISRQLKSPNIRVINLDRAFKAEDFLDNDHLTAHGNSVLASDIERVVEP